MSISNYRFLIVTAMSRILHKSFYLILLLVCASQAYAWGDRGHRVIALIAWHYLTPATQAKIDNILRLDRSGLTATDFASEATWADAYRDSDRNTTRVRYEQTRHWHYINLEIAHPDFVSACFGSSPLRLSQRASEGSAQSCSVDKVEQFARELGAVNTTDAERLFALQFVMHLVGDIHQPLHASDNDDEGGNTLSVSAKNFDGSLHAFWDNAVIAKGAPETIAR
ncbi:MAG TPA: S1/P1 nuclease, partial [Spongiibacteraceae bacterium]